jgi:PAS domain S-box-containing protein
MNIIDSLENESVEGVQLLNQTIVSFNGAAQKFEKYYRHLEKRVRDLDVELADKNKELKRNLIEKEEVKNYLRNILESLTIGVIVVDLKDRVSTFNRAAEDMTGMNFGEVKGENIDDILGSEIFPMLKTKAELLRDIKQKGEIETELVKEGVGVVYINVSSFPVLDPQGTKIGTALTLQDITQLKRLEEKANRTDRLAAMGEMAAEIAHEIRNPLGSIELFATALKKDLEDFEDLKYLAEHISSGVRSLNNIISNLLLFIRPHQKPEFQVVDILKTLKEALAFSYELIETNERKIDVVIDIPPNSLTVHGDAELLKQAWLNLIMNAVQAMPDGGRLVISAKELSRVHLGTNTIEVLFKDTGYGVSGVNISKIFNPFFTTKKKGTGLGLAIVHNILKIHGGDIDVESTEDEGTVCRVKIPLWKGQDIVG